MVLFLLNLIRFTGYCTRYNKTLMVRKEGLKVFVANCCHIALKKIRKDFISKVEHSYANVLYVYVFASF